LIFFLTHFDVSFSEKPISFETAPGEEGIDRLTPRRDIKGQYFLLTLLAHNPPKPSNPMQKAIPFSQRRNHNKTQVIHLVAALPMNKSLGWSSIGGTLDQTCFRITYGWANPSSWIRPV